MEGNEYAAMNLRTIADNIKAYASYATTEDPQLLEKRTQHAVRSVERLANYIDNK